MPGFDRVEKTMPDAMHTVAVQVKHLHRCLAGKAPEDSLSVRKQEMSLNRFPECWPTPGTEEAPQAGNSSKSSDSCRRGKKNKNNQKKVKDSSSLPSAPFGLNKKQMEEADTRAKQVIVPAGDPFSPGPIFSRMSRMNSHEWKEVSISS